MTLGGWSDLFDYLSQLLAGKTSAGLLFMIFIVESVLRLLTAPIIGHLGLAHDFFATGSTIIVRNTRLSL